MENNDLTNLKPEEQMNGNENTTTSSKIEDGQENFIESAKADTPAQITAEEHALIEKLIEPNQLPVIEAPVEKTPQLLLSKKKRQK